MAEHLDLLSRFSRTGLIRPEVLQATERDLKVGGSVINTLHRHLGDDTDRVWSDLAARSNRTYIPHPAAAGPIDVRLLPLHLALDHLIVPRVRSFTAVHLISPDPLARLADYASLRPHFAGLVPGGQPVLRIDLAPPAAFRELFSLAYPDARQHWRDVQDAAALAALLPRAAWDTYRPTPEEETDAQATFLGLPYIDPETYPPTPGALGEHPGQPFLSRRLYPHSVNEHGHLTVLGAVARQDELVDVQKKVSTLQEALMQPLTLALTSQRRLVRLLKRLHQEVHA